MSPHIRAFACLLIATLASAYAFAQYPDLEVEVDWTQKGEPVNRAIFSTQGYMQVYVEEDPMVLESFHLINPYGTQTRLETYIHQMEPENDNDDPSVFNWDKLYPNKMIRFIDDRETFEKHLADVGMDILSLVCYNVDWLKSENEDDQVADHDEWAEFAAAVVESYNGSGEDYEPNLKYMEIWNEPDFSHFVMGTKEAYFDLFNKAASRIRANYPGVQIVGPATTQAVDYTSGPGGLQFDPDTPNHTAWMKAFLETCGENLDVVSFHHYGPKGQGTDILIDSIVKYTDMFRALPGKENGKAMITETDAWFDGWDKIQFILERQFRFMEIADRIEAIHHFCCMYYNESGNYGFGIVGSKGEIVEGVFWPYWLFRNLVGDLAPTKIEGKRAGDIRLLASSFEHNGQSMATAVFHNKSDAQMQLRAFLKFPAAEGARHITVDRLSQGGYGVQNAIELPKEATTQDITFNLEPGEGLALNLLESGKKRIFGFRDLNNQEKPWIGMKTNVEKASLGDKIKFDVRVLNTIGAPLSGVMKVHGLPKGWTVETVRGSENVVNLTMGQETKATLEAEVSTFVPQKSIVPYVVLESEGSSDDVREQAHSLPVSIEMLSPLQTRVLPQPIHAVPGESNTVTLQIENHSKLVSKMTFSHRTPWQDEAVEVEGGFEVGPHGRERFDFPLDIPADAEPGAQLGEIVIHFMGSTLETNYTVEVGEGSTNHKAKPVDLSSHLNFDPVAYWTDRGDIDHSMGQFLIPGDYTPGGRIVNVRGVPFDMPSIEDGEKCAVLPQGQKIEIPEGEYTGVAMMGFGHDGKHHGEWILHYADGTQEAVASQIPEWCTPPPDGFQVAFNMPHRYWPTGIAHPACELFTWTLPIDPSKRLVGVELPTFDRGAYIFAITMIEK